MTALNILKEDNKMSVKVKELLEQEIESQIKALDDIEYGSDQHSACVGDTVKLLEKLNEMNRIEQDHIDKEEIRGRLET